jgi:imidazolonepropionase-like amidohydrolase
MAVQAGVDSVEHVFEDSFGCMEDLVEEMVKHETIWVPTLATAEEDFEPEKFGRCKKAVKAAFDKGVRLAAGGDAGVFNHGLNAREMEIMMEAGIPVEDVLVAGTYTGWQACGGDKCGYRFGCWEEGNRADIIALDADPRKDPKALRKVSFVMKDARVWKRDGRPVDMVAATQWPEELERLAEEERKKSSATSGTSGGSMVNPTTPSTQSPDMCSSPTSSCDMGF